MTLRQLKKSPLLCKVLYILVVHLNSVGFKWRMLTNVCGGTGKMLWIRHDLTVVRVLKKESFKFTRVDEPTKIKKTFYILNSSDTCTVTPLL